MKPHRRKPTSPRKEGATPPSDQAPPEPQEMTPPPAEEAYSQPEQPYVDPGEAAYVDPNAGYVDPGQAYVDPNQAYVDPNAGYVDPNQVPADPGQAYPDPNAGYVDPNQVPADPGQAYVDPNQGAAVPPPPAITQGPGVYDDAPATQEPAPAPAAPASSRRRPRAATKKKVVRRGPQRRPATPPGRGRYQPPKPSYGGGFSLMTVFVTMAVLGLIGVIAMVMIPRDLNTISGYPAKLETDGVPRNILDEAQRLMISRGKELAISETELNTYLNQRLQADQGGLMASIVDFKGVYVDLAPETAEVFIEREVFGFPLTMSSKVKAEVFRGKVVYRPAGWSIGKLETEKTTMRPVMELFKRLRATCIDEYQVLQQMHNVRFEDDKVVLDATI